MREQSCAVRGAKELQITARRGALEFSYHDETERLQKALPVLYSWIRPKPRPLHFPSVERMKTKSSKLSSSFLSAGQLNGPSTKLLVPIAPNSLSTQDSYSL
jgi:hypothetical protein